jgi:hypothetical protein
LAVFMVHQDLVELYKKELRVKFDVFSIDEERDKIKKEGEEGDDEKVVSDAEVFGRIVKRLRKEKTNKVKLLLDLVIENSLKLDDFINQLKMIPKRFILAKSSLKSLLNLKREDEEKPDLKEDEVFPEEAEHTEKSAD